MRAGNDPTTQELIEQHLPLVRHVVFQVAVNFPVTSTVRSWPPPAPSGWSRRLAATTPSGGSPSTASPPSASGARSSMPSGPPTGRPGESRDLARRLESIEQRLASSLGRMPSAEETG